MTWVNLYRLAYYYNQLQKEAIKNIEDYWIINQMRRINPLFLEAATSPTNESSFIYKMMDVCLKKDFLEFNDDQAINSGIVYFIINYLEKIHEKELVNSLVHHFTYKMMIVFNQIRKELEHGNQIEIYKTYEQFKNDIIRQHNEKSFFLDRYNDVKLYYQIIISMMHDGLILDQKFDEPLDKMRTYLLAIYEDSPSKKEIIEFIDLKIKSIKPTQSITKP
jgi:hypothetical protein